MSHRPKHILFLPRWYPYQFDPMFGLFVKKQAEAVALYNQVSVIYVQGIPRHKQFEKRQTFDAPNFSTQIYYYRHSKFKLWNAIRFWYYLMIGFRSIKKKNGKPDIVHVHILTRLGIFALLLKTIYNTPYIITEHWSRYLPIPGTYKGWLRKKLGQIIVKKATAILPVSRNLAEAMQNHGLQNLNYHLVPNVVDDLFFQSIKKKESQHQTVFLHVSTFEDRSKNISGILRTIQRLAKRNIDFKFWFVGGGMDFESLTKYARALKIPREQIRFLGLKQGKELVDAYSNADYLVLFSNFENIPVVINEAQALGLPVISTKVGGISEVINADNGFLIDTGNENQLEAILEYVLTHRPSFNSIDIQKKAKASYSYESVAQQLQAIY